MGENIELRIDLLGSVLPAAIRVYIRYLKEDSDVDEMAISPVIYTNVTNMLIAYIPNSYTPPFMRFKIMIALGTDTAHIGPYRPPTKDIVYGKWP